MSSSKRLCLALICASFAITSGSALANPPVDPSAPPSLGAHQDASLSAGSTRVLKKLRQLDLLNQLLPILWKKNQIETVLKALDGVKDRVADEEKIEAQKLLEKESKIDEQLDKSLKSGTLPGKDLFNEVNSDISKMTAIRALIAHQNEDDVYTAMDKALTDGQKKEIANTLDPSIVDPKIKVADLSQEAKIRFFVRYIMLDPLTYDLLIKLESLPFTQ